MSKPWTPQPYQLQALEFGVSRPSAGLMLDPGLGKTSTTLALFSLLLESKDVRKGLVVAPLRVARTVWPAEGRKWSDFNHLRIVDLCGLDPKSRESILREGNYDLVCINPESLHKVIGLKGFEKLGFDMLIIDESTKFKDTQTMRFKALKKVLWSFKRRVILTGTPVPNGLADLFGQMYVLDEGERLGKYITHFRMEYMWQPPGMVYDYKLRPGADVLIYEKVRDILLRMQSKHHLVMPELVKNFIEVELPPKLRKHYKELDDDFITTIEENPIVAFNTSAVGVKLRQFANGFLYQFLDPDRPELRSVLGLHDEKLDALEELVEEMQGRPLLVAYEFIADAERIQARFPTAVNLGNTKDVEGVVRSFNSGLIPLLIAHPASAGHGLNLQEACSTVAWYGITWDLELYQQFIARVWRQGQAAAQVVVHHIVCKATRDEKVMKALEDKDITQEKFNAALISR